MQAVEERAVTTAGPQHQGRREQGVLQRMGLPSVARREPAVGSHACAMWHLLRKAAHRSAAHTRCVQIAPVTAPDFNRKPVCG